MRILILTQYFPPEVGAPQNRLFELAVRLQKNGIDTTILTAMPNYPQMKIHEKYKNKIYTRENMSGLDVYRSWIFVSQKRSIVFRLLNYFSFVFSSLFLGLFLRKKVDFIFCESPPLFLGITAHLLSKFKRAKLIFNVSDLWPESAEKLGIIENKFFLNLSTRLEEFLYKNSIFITGQTQGIVHNIKRRFPSKNVYWLPNGVDLNIYNFSSSELESNVLISYGVKPEDKVFLYGGIIGYAQGLEIIVEAANLLQSESKVKFVLLGNGPEKQKLIDLVAHYKLDNVIFIDTVQKAMMPSIVNSITAAIIPLKKLDLFKGAIPSKIFENLAMKKPILLGVDGEAKELFIDQGNCGLFFEPENYVDLKDKIVELLHRQDKVKELGDNGFNFVKENFNRDKITLDFITELHKIDS
jgi:glycosyltransferase involved in cell wall biosynthesis